MIFILGVFIGQAASTCPHDRLAARASDRSSWPPGFNINDRGGILASRREGYHEVRLRLLRHEDMV